MVSQGQLSIGTSVVPSRSQQLLSHPIVIKPSSKRPCTSVIMGVEALPADPYAMIMATVARIISPVNPQTSLIGLASHQAIGAASHLRTGAQATVIGTIHGPGPTGPITTQTVSTEPDISILSIPAWNVQVHMIMDEDDREEGGGEGAQTFTRLLEQKKERESPTSHLKRVRSGG